jgi:hypothetical protein
MSGFTLFTNSTDGISFEPEYGFKEQDKKIENTVRTRSAIMATYKFSDFRRWKIPVRYVNSVTKETLNNWWRMNTELFFFDNNDTDFASTYRVRITNKSTPINVVEKPYDYEWKGTIELEEY